MQPQLPITIPAPQQPHPQGGTYPDWINQMIHANQVGAGHRNATVHACHRCGSLVITGLNDTTCAHTIHADPTPLTETEELACLIASRPTYTATIHHQTILLDSRDHWHMHRPALVVPAHRCGTHPINPGTILPTQPKEETRHDHPQY